MRFQHKSEESKRCGSLVAAKIYQVKSRLVWYKIGRLLFLQSQINIDDRRLSHILDQFPIQWIREV